MGQPHAGAPASLPAQRCGGLTFSHEREELRTRTAGLGESDVARAKGSQKIRRTPGHQKRFRSLRQKPQDFMETLERTKHVVDIIRKPTPFGAGSEERLEHRLEHLIGESIGDEEAVVIKKVKLLRLGKKVFANIAKADGVHWYCVDFPHRPHACELKIEIWSNTESNGVRFYIDRHDTPTPSSFEWWSPGNSSVTIGPDDKRFQFGRYWITVVALGPEARYMLHCTYNIHRPPVQTVHDMVAEKMLRQGVKQHLLASNERYTVSRNSTKVMSAAYREQFKPTRQMQKAGAHAVDGILQAHFLVGVPSSPLPHNPQGRKSPRRPASAIAAAGREEHTDTAIYEKIGERCNVFEKRYLQSTLEPCSMLSRSVSVKESPFNPSKLRESLALIHESGKGFEWFHAWQAMSANSNIKEKVENGAVDALDVCAEFMARSMRLTIESTTRSAAHRLGGRLVSAFTSTPGYPLAGKDIQKTRTRGQWSVTTEDPRIRKMIGREGLPSRMYILRHDAVDYRTHSFDTGHFRLSRVGALEMSTDSHAAEENANDVDYKHLAQIQELVLASEITLFDQPSGFFCFRLEFPPDSPKAKASNTGTRQDMIGQSHLITLAAASAEQRTQWLEALNLFCELTAAERERAAKRAAAKKQRLAAAKNDKLADALTISPTAAADGLRDIAAGHNSTGLLESETISAKENRNGDGAERGEACGQCTSVQDAGLGAFRGISSNGPRPSSAVPSSPGQRANATIAATRPTPPRPPRRPASALR